MISQSKRILLCGSALLAALPTSAFAQEAQTASANQGADIIVTAQRRDESLSKTPVAVQIIGADQLQKAQVKTQDDLRVALPGLQIRSGVDSTELNFAVRGQSKDPLTESAPGVLPYFNEVPLGGGKIDASLFYDLQSVQALKGPQGTLFGRSAVGGAVLYTTAKPQKDFGGFVDGSIGDHALYSADGAVNLPIVADTLLLRVAGAYRERHGFQFNDFPGNVGRLGDTRKYGIRSSVTLNLDRFHNDLVVDYQHTKGAEFNSVISGLIPFTGVGAPFVPTALLYGGITNPVARATGIFLVGAFTGAPPAASAAYYDAYFAPGTGHNPGGLSQELIDQQARGPYRVHLDGRPKYNGHGTIATNTSTFELNDDTRIKNIFGYTNTYYLAGYDSDGTGFGLGNDYLRKILNGGTVDGGNSERYRQVSEELQLQGSLFSDRLNYTTGVYFSDERRKFFNLQPFFDILFGGQTQTNSYRINNREYAGYGQGTYKLNDSGLSVTAGLRYSSDRVQKILLPDDSFAVKNPIAPAGFSYDQKATYNRLSYQFGIQDQVNSNLLIYAVTRRAYKAGGYNGTIAPKVGTAAIAGDTFIAEKVSDVEVGTKFQGRIGGMPTRLTVTGYYDWIDNSQRLAFTLANGNPSSLTVNVPKGKFYGVELEGVIQPARWLSLGGNFDYIHATFSATPVLANGDSQIYDQVPDTPKYVAAAFADVTVPFTNDLSVLAHADVYHQSVSYTTARSLANDGATLSQYTLANFRLGVQNETKGWSLTANLKNAFDKRYYTGGLATGEIFQVQILVPAEPRTFSVDARFKF